MDHFAVRAHVSVLHLKSDAVAVFRVGGFDVGVTVQGSGDAQAVPRTVCPLGASSCVHAKGSRHGGKRIRHADCGDG